MNNEDDIVAEAAEMMRRAEELVCEARNIKLTLTARHDQLEAKIEALEASYRRTRRAQKWIIRALVAMNVVFLAELVWVLFW